VSTGLDLAESPEDTHFREELRAYLREHLPSESDGGFAAQLEWQRTLHAGRWVAPQWPAQYGGRDATPSQYAVYWREMAAAGAPQIANRIGIQTVGPTLLACGSDEQRQRYLAPIASGEEIWCQLFSEPGAGSDLGGLRTTATLDGDHWVVSGQKVWTSYGAEAQFGLLLARTEAAVEGSAGISCMICDMTDPGVTARPLRQISGEYEFSEVFLDDVRIPASAIIGERGKGWRVARAALISERGIAFPMKEQMILEARVAGLVDTLRAQAPAGARRRATVVECVIDYELFRLMNLRTLTKVSDGEDISAWTSLAKLAWSRAAQRIAEAQVDLADLGGLAGDPAVWFEFLRSRMASIAGGTTEIQLSIIGDRLLGLPR
jgi:alkylation response protein AidB-like acyl-CoA dehydrogenase